MIPLKDLLQVSAGAKQQVATGFDLIHGVLVAKAALVLLVEIQRETETRAVDPALTDLAQAPYRLGLRQGLCDRGQGGGRGDGGETVTLLGERDPAGGGVRGDVLMAIEHDLRAERRVAGHLDREMPPLRIEDVEGVMVHERSLRREVSDDPAAGPGHLPDRGICATDQDEEQPLDRRILLEVVGRDPMFPVVRRAVADGNVMGLGIRLDAPAESSGQAHEVSSVQVRVGPAMLLPPPGAEAAGGAAHRTIGVQDDAIHAPVRGIEEVGVVAAHVLSGHARQRIHPQRRFQRPRRGQA
jgi:hypothetical protein